MTFDFEIREIMKTRSFLIIIDSQLSSKNGYLRSLHFLQRASNNALKKVVVWEPGRNCNKPLDTTGMNLEFIHPSSFLKSDLLHCVFVNDEKDNQYFYVNKYVEGSIPSIIVVNHSNFIPGAWFSVGKSLESKSSFPIRTFNSELEHFLSHNDLLEFQFIETMNFAFTEVHALHSAIKSEKARRIIDLLDFEDEELSPSPIWDWAIALTRLKKENRVANLYVFLFNALRPLLERNRDVDAVASEFESIIRLHRGDENLLIENRRKKLKTGLMAWLRALETVENTYIRSRMKSQLRGLGCP